MSSHHIVREKQEPALLVLDADTLEADALGQLLEWSPTVLVAADCYEAIDSLGIKIDVVIGDRPEFAQPQLVSEAVGTDIFSAGLEFLVSRAYPSVNIVTADFDLEAWNRFAGKINLVILNRSQRLFPVRSPFSKWKAADEPVRLYGELQGLHTTGLVRLGPRAGDFKTTSDGFYTLNFPAPRIFVGEMY